MIHNEANQTSSSGNVADYRLRWRKHRWSSFLRNRGSIVKDCWVELRWKILWSREIRDRTELFTMKEKANWIKIWRQRLHIYISVIDCPWSSYKGNHTLLHYSRQWLRRSMSFHMINRQSEFCFDHSTNSPSCWSFACITSQLTPTAHLLNPWGWHIDEVRVSRPRRR